MNHYAGIDVSLECSSVCVVEATGKFVHEGKVASEPEALIGWFCSTGLSLEWIGLEAGPLSQWLYAAMQKAGLSRRCGELFAVENEVLLYDVTSNYFEGQAQANPQAQRGYSRDVVLPKRMRLVEPEAPRLTAIA